MSLPADSALPLPELPPRWLRPLLLTALSLSLPALVIAMTVPHRPLTKQNLEAMEFDPGTVVHWLTSLSLGLLLAYLYVLVPVMLLCALFCARRGTERRQASETGMLPALLLFGLLMFVTGFTTHLPYTWPIYSVASYLRPFVEVSSGAYEHDNPVTAPTFCLLLLACFATLRADPPAPPRTGFIWTLAAGALGAWCAYREVDAVGSFGTLGLYIWWAAGWRRVANFSLGAAIAGVIIFIYLVSSSDLIIPVYFDVSPWSAETMRHLSWPTIGVFGATFVATASLGYMSRRRLLGASSPEPAASMLPADAPTPSVLPAPLPAAPAHKVIDLLLLMALMGVPSALIRIMRFGIKFSVGSYIVLPLSLVASLCFVRWLERPNRTMHGVLGVVALAVLLWSVFELSHICRYTAVLIRQDHLYPMLQRFD